MSNLRSAFSQALRSASTSQKELLGTKRVESDGRVFRYAKAVAALVAGKIAIGAVQVANHINRVIQAAYPVGTVELLVTVGATAVTVDQYAGGTLQVNDEAGEGYSYPIESNTACDASGVTVVQLAEGLQVALTALTSEVSLIPNIRNGVSHSATEENFAAGVALCAVAAGSFCWLQTGGDGIVLMDGTPAVGSNLTLGSVAGSVAVLSAIIATTVAQPIVGVKTFGAGVTAEYKPIYLTLD